jgi:hypothetical protein
VQRLDGEGAEHLVGEPGPNACRGASRARKTSHVIAALAAPCSRVAGRNSASRAGQGRPTRAMSHASATAGGTQAR